jgi:proline iminopeptidase
MIAYDVRGRGASGHPGRARRGFAVQVDDLEAVLDALLVERTILLGCSLDAGVVTQFALRRPGRVAGLVLVAPIGLRWATGTQVGRAPDPAALARLDQLRASGLPVSDPPAWTAAWRSVYVPLLLSDPARFGTMADVSRHPNESPERVAATTLEVLAELRGYDWSDEVASLDVPVAIIRGEDDPEPSRSAQEWLEVMPRAELTEIAGAGSLPWVDQPAAVADAVRRLVDRTR